MTFVGIAPGRAGSGAIAWLSGNRHHLRVEACPARRGEPDLAAMVEVLARAASGQGARAVLERGAPNADPEYWGWRGILAAMGLRLQLVRPAAWRRIMLAGAREGVAGLADLFPNLPIGQLVAGSESAVTAVYLAEYGRTLAKFRRRR